MDEWNKDAIANMDAAKIKVYHFDDVSRAGEANDSFVQEPCLPDDNLMFSYTSGTTGDPKGVKTSQLAILSMCSSLQISLGLNALLKEILTFHICHRHIFLKLRYLLLL